MKRVYTEEQKRRRAELQVEYRQKESYKIKRRAYENKKRNTDEYKTKKSVYNKAYNGSVCVKERKKEKFKTPEYRAELFFKTIKKRAYDQGKDFDLTVEWLIEKLNGVCELSGIPFNLDNYGEGHNKFYSPSVDRINNEVGYLMSNCRMVLFSVNAGKHTGSDEDFYNLITAIYEARMEKNTNSPNKQSLYNMENL